MNIRELFGGAISTCAALLYVVGIPSKAEAQCRPAQCDVDDFEQSETDRERRTHDDQIAAAIAAAHHSGITSVRLGPGTYYLSRPITLSEPNIRLDLRGEGRELTRLVPVIGYGTVAAPFFPMINLAARGGVFERFSVTLGDFAVDQETLRTRPEYLDSSIVTANAHGIQVDDGWRDPFGQLIIEGVDIRGSPGYGIGIQNNGANDVTADNVVIRDVRIYNTGADGIDTKTPANGPANTTLTIERVLVENYGLNEKDADREVTFSAGIDLRYNSVTLNRVTIRGGTKITAAHGNNLTNLTALNFRPGSRGTEANPTLITAVHISGGRYGISAANRGDQANAHIIARDSRIEGFAEAGIAIAGSHMTFVGGCALGGVESSAPVRVDEAHADMATITYQVTTDPLAVQCRALANVGHDS